MRMPQWRLRRPRKAWSFSTLSHSLITDCSADAAAQRDSTQAQSNQNSLFLSNETAIGLIWPGCAIAEQNEVENRGLRQCIRHPGGFAVCGSRATRARNVDAIGLTAVGRGQSSA